MRDSNVTWSHRSSGVVSGGIKTLEVYTREHPLRRRKSWLHPFISERGGETQRDSNLCLTKQVMVLLLTWFQGWRLHWDWKPHRHCMLCSFLLPFYARISARSLKTYAHCHPALASFSNGSEQPVFYNSQPSIINLNSLMTGRSCWFCTVYIQKPNLPSNTQHSRENYIMSYSVYFIPLSPS